MINVIPNKSRDVIPNGVRNLFLNTAKTRFFGFRPQNDDLRQIGLTESELLHS